MSGIREAKLRGDSGLTLVEILIALALMALVLLPVMI
ncbi:MAG: prepilin-type N-terminal cleavage/methylation domain-containing protein, partial [Gemmatimonadales bacterium]|nr:prepilin-type N-terminal cleavage/methylation domain-containing protein [Gemmatimonadales bacterium]